MGIFLLHQEDKMCYFSAFVKAHVNTIIKSGTTMSPASFAGVRKP